MFGSQESEDLTPILVSDVMRREVVAIAPEADLLTACRLMHALRVRHVLATRDEILLGVLSERNVFQTL